MTDQGHTKGSPSVLEDVIANYLSVLSNETDNCWHRHSNHAIPNEDQNKKIEKKEWRPTEDKLFGGYRDICKLD